MSLSSNPPIENSARESAYVGRFAPSPTGPLHYGSAIAAVASYLDAKANRGRWLLRMEDLDPPREPAGAAEQILTQLQQLGLQWDGDVLYQSKRLAAYQLALEYLQKNDMCFACDCTRGQLREMNSVYDGRCRNRGETPKAEFAIRVKTTDQIVEFADLVQGRQRHNIASETGDFVLRRKDTLFAYQLAVVVDDEFQGITHVIRGYDLLDSSPRQIYLQAQLNYRIPVYGHIPVIVNAEGQKLSKQHFAAAVNGNNAPAVIYQCLDWLGQAPPAQLKSATASTQLQWGVENWDIQAVPKLATIPQHSCE